MDRIKDILSNPKTSLALCLLGGVLIIGGLVTNGFAKPKLPTTLKAADFPAKSIDSSVSEFKVDVSGAVANPGVYSLPNDSRVEDAIKAAGGFSLDANGEFVAKSVKAKVVTLSELVVLGDKETGADGNELDSAIGNSYIESDENTKVVYNNRVKKNSQIIITFRDNTGGPWWISNQGDGFFEVNVPASMGYNIRFGYWVVGVEGGESFPEGVGWQEGDLDTDSLPPEILGSGAVNITDAGATINWTTNEDSDSVVVFSAESASSTAEQTVVDGNLVISHSVNLAGLAPNTTINYIVKSTDEAGNESVSANYSFTTASPDSSPSQEGDDQLSSTPSDSSSSSTPEFPVVPEDTGASSSTSSDSSDASTTSTP